MNEKITSFDLATSAVSLSSAIAGLDSFASERLTGIEVSRDDISALHGLLNAISCFAEKHEAMAMKYFDDGLFKVEAIELKNNLE